MAKSIIVYGVPGGKTRFAQRIADHFGLKSIRKGLIGSIYGSNSLAFVEDEAASVPWKTIGFETRSFQSVADEINAAIPLTDWQSGPPPMVGEWEVERAGCRRGDKGDRRWWDGDDWSVWFREYDAQEDKNSDAGSPSISASPNVFWRGLSAEPIKVQP